MTTCVDCRMPPCRCPEVTGAGGQCAFAGGDDDAVGGLAETARFGIGGRQDPAQPAVTRRCLAGWRGIQCAVVAATDGGGAEQVGAIRSKTRAYIQWGASIV